MNPKLKLTFAFICCIALGFGIAYVYVNYQATLAQWFLAKPKHYQTENIELISKTDNMPLISLEWSQLLPVHDKAILQKYQQRDANTVSELTDNILLSIQAATDTAYSNTMMSVDTVDSFDGELVSIAGFIVPIDFFDTQNPQNIFIVPYFGACVHFPPPPPNQIIFAQLDGKFKDFDLTQAYRLKGVLSRDLFEDPLGTSAYVLDVVSIESYFDNPDDFRAH